MDKKAEDMPSKEGRDLNLAQEAAELTYQQLVRTARTGGISANIALMCVLSIEKRTLMADLLAPRVMQDPELWLTHVNDLHDVFPWSIVDGIFLKVVVDLNNSMSAYEGSGPLPQRPIVSSPRRTRSDLVPLSCCDLTVGVSWMNKVELAQVMSTKKAHMPTESFSADGPVTYGPRADKTLLLGGLREARKEKSKGNPPPAGTNSKRIQPLQALDAALQTLSLPTKTHTRDSSKLLGISATRLNDVALNPLCKRQLINSFTRQALQMDVNSVEGRSALPVVDTTYIDNLRKATKRACEKSTKVSMSSQPPVRTQTSSTFVTKPHRKLRSDTLGKPCPSSTSTGPSSTSTGPSTSTSTVVAGNESKDQDEEDESPFFDYAFSAYE